VEHPSQGGDNSVTALPLEIKETAGWWRQHSSLPTIPHSPLNFDQSDHTHFIIIIGTIVKYNWSIYCITEEYYFTHHTNNIDQ
jgi:hypothetical protein